VSELPGNEFLDAYRALLADGKACPDPAAALEAISPLLVTAIVGALAFEQRTANLIALLQLGRAPVGIAWPEWENQIQPQIAARLGLEVPDA
jgi:hypothetical protein